MARRAAILLGAVLLAVLVFMLARDDASRVDGARPPSAQPDGAARERTSSPSTDVSDASRGSAAPSSAAPAAFAGSGGDRDAEPRAFPAVDREHVPLLVSVLDQSGVPMAGVPVQLRSVSADEAARLRTIDAVPSDAGALIDGAVTGTEGGARFVPAMGHYVVAVDPDAASASLLRRDDTAAVVEIRPNANAFRATLRVHRKPSPSEASRFLLGTVVDAAGEPIAGAEVLVIAVESRGKAPSLKIRFRGTTVLDGTFAFGPVEDGDWEIVVDQPTGSAGACREPFHGPIRPGEPLTLTLHETFCARVLVTGAGAISEVRAFRDGRQAGEGSSRGGGQFLLRSLEPGRYDFVASTPPWNDGGARFGAARGVEIASEGPQITPVEIALEPAASLHVELKGKSDETWWISFEHDGLVFHASPSRAPEIATYAVPPGIVTIRARPGSRSDAEPVLRDVVTMRGQAVEVTLTLP